MTSARIVDVNGAVQGSVELPDAVFGVTPHASVMHQSVVRHLANRRQGTHDTKRRGEVRGGGRKPYRQKGTGRARQGSIRAPQWEGGGVVFGPHPHGYEQRMPRKQRRLALRSALSVKASLGQVVVLGPVDMEEPRTRVVVDLMRAVEAGRRVLVVLGAHNEMLERSARNIPEVRVTLAGNLSVRDLLIAETVLISQEALEHVAEAFA